MRKPNKKSKKIKDTKPILVKAIVKWEDAYPFLEETYKHKGEQVLIQRYFSFEDKTAPILANLSGFAILLNSIM